MQFGIFEILGIIAAAQLLLLTIFLVTQKKGYRLRNKILAAFLLAGALIIVDLLHLRFQLHLKFPYFLLSGFSFTFLQGPLLYFYAKATTDRDFVFKKVHLVHLLPFLLFWASMVIGYHSKPLQVKLDLITSAESRYGVEFAMGNLFIHFQIIAYMAAALRGLHKFRLEYRDRVRPLSLNWLTFGLSVFLIMWSLHLILQLIGWVVELPLMLHFGFSFLCMVLYFIFANFAVFKSLKQPELILGETLTTEKLKYENSTLTSAESEQILKQLLDCMDAQRPYLHPSVAIDEIARALHIPSRHLSQVINENLNQHFFDFINRYRIEEAKRLISDSTGNRKTMLEILYEIGFNSKSAFNSAFKKHADMTPREFKRVCKTGAGKS